MSTQLSDLLTTIRKEQAERQGAADDASRAVKLTYGPSTNNLTGPIAMGSGTWNLSLVDRLSPDIVHRYAAEMGIMYRKVNKPNLLSPTPKAVKDLLIKDRYPVIGK